jgi:hypothetical protein
MVPVEVQVVPQVEVHMVRPMEVQEEESEVAEVMVEFKMMVKISTMEAVAAVDEYFQDQLLVLTLVAKRAVAVVVTALQALPTVEVEVAVVLLVAPVQAVAQEVAEAGVHQVVPAAPAAQVDQAVKQLILMDIQLLGQVATQQEFMGA